MGQLKEQFDSNAEKKETPAWVTQFVNDLRTKKTDANLGEALEKAALANAAKDADKGTVMRTAFDQVTKEIRKQFQQYPKDAVLLRENMVKMEGEFIKLEAGALGASKPARARPGNNNRRPPE